MENGLAVWRDVMTQAGFDGEAVALVVCGGADVLTRDGLDEVWATWHRRHEAADDRLVCVVGDDGNGGHNSVCVMAGEAAHQVLLPGFDVTVRSVRAALFNCNRRGLDGGLLVWSMFNEMDRGLAPLTLRTRGLRSDGIISSLRAAVEGLYQPAWVG